MALRVEPAENREQDFGMALLSSVFLLGKSAISLFVLSRYHLTYFKRIRRQQASRSSTWKIRATFDKKAILLGFTLSLLNLLVCV